MRRFITIGIKPNNEVEILHGADKSRSEHREEFNKLGAGKAKKKSEFAEVQVIDLSRGVVKRKRFGDSKVDGKRTVARTVEKKKTVARSKKRKRAEISRRRSSETELPVVPASTSDANPPADNSKPPSADEGTFPASSEA